MHGELSISISTVLGFGLTLARLLGLFIFLPWPGAQAGPSMARVAFALACTMALQPMWPVVNGVPGIATLDCTARRRSGDRTVCGRGYSPGWERSSRWARRR